MKKQYEAGVVQEPPPVLVQRNIEVLRLRDPTSKESREVYSVRCAERLSFLLLLPPPAMHMSSTAALLGTVVLLYAWVPPLDHGLSC